MTTAEYAKACRLRSKELIRIAECLYDSVERASIESAIDDLEVLAIASGPWSPEAEAPSALPRYLEACRLRTAELLKIAQGMYDDAERFLLERAIGELEVLGFSFIEAATGDLDVLALEFAGSPDGRSPRP
jgi:hypothetical protein